MSETTSMRRPGGDVCPADTFRVYSPEECGDDGYPGEWHRTIKGLVRRNASYRCVRCHPPYSRGDGEWSRCDEQCSHGMPARCEAHPFLALGGRTTTGELIREARTQGVERVIEAQWRILTVHHLDGDKANCRWWNLVSLCQRCHLQVQGKVKMERRWLHEHSEWFKPYVAGFYASTLLGEELSRREVETRLGELLALEERQLTLGEAA